MKLVVADAQDTLRKIALKYNIDSLQMISCNPHIANLDLNIHGKIVRFPTPDITDKESTFTPPYLSESTAVDREAWIPLTPLEQMANTEYDVIIVGTGAGGGAVLRRLCEKWKNNGKRIGIIEAGNLLLPTHVRNIPTMDEKRIDEYYRKVSIWIGKSLPDFSGARELFALGGRTLFGVFAAPRMPASETVGWPITEKELSLYYSLAEEIMEVSNEYAKGSSLQEIVVKRLRENGFPGTSYIPTTIDLEPTRYGEIHSDPFWSAISLLAYSVNRKSFDLAVKARAVEVFVEKDKAIGIKVMSPDKKSFFLRSKTIVLSGSTFETPRLLLHSGIQGNAIGHYLINHSFLNATAKVSREDSPEVLGILSLIIPQTKEQPYQIQMGGPNGYFWHQKYKEEPLLDELQFGISAFGKVESRFENYVSLDPYKKDEYGVPEIQVQFSYSDRDKVIIHKMKETMNHAAIAMGTPLISKEGQPAIMFMPPGSDYHESGTCRRGDDPSTSATNGYGQIHGISNLYVADNSILPSIGGTNPSLSTVALAIYTADHIIDQLK